MPTTTTTPGPEAVESPSQQPVQSTPLNIGDQLAAQICLLGMQQVADNARLSQNTLLAFQKDLFQGGQAELGSMLATFRAPQVRTTSSG